LKLAIKCDKILDEYSKSNGGPDGAAAVAEMDKITGLTTPDCEGEEPKPEPAEPAEPEAPPEPTEVPGEPEVPTEPAEAPEVPEEPEVPTEPAEVPEVPEEPAEVPEEPAESKDYCVAEDGTEITPNNNLAPAENTPPTASYDDPE